MHPFSVGLVAVLSSLEPRQNCHVSSPCCLFAIAGHTKELMMLLLEIQGADVRITQEVVMAAARLAGKVGS